MEPAAGNHGVLPQLQLDELLLELQSRLQAILATRDRMHGLLEAVVAIGSGLDLESTLKRIVEAAVRLVDAQYGALGGDRRRAAAGRIRAGGPGRGRHQEDRPLAGRAWACSGCSSVIPSPLRLATSRPARIRRVFPRGTRR